MIITARIKGIKYTTCLTPELEIICYKNFDIQTCPSCCRVQGGNFVFNLSKWVSPKRTRSYPFERVYNTLNGNKKITVIPIIKDEGCRGDRDFIQWDTISLMSLLNVYVILGYYDKARINPRNSQKITSQQMNNDYIKEKIREISTYHSSSLHWNIKEITESLPGLIDNVIKSYNNISKVLNVNFHSPTGIEKFQAQLAKGAKNFMESSRQQALMAQNREYLTVQPKEVLKTLTKAKINISNYLGGLYHLTTDEIEISNNKLYLIESKHSKSSKLPSISDIKDGLLKMILYSNLEEVMIDEEEYIPIPVLKLTSSVLKYGASFDSGSTDLNDFIEINELSPKQTNAVKLLFKECNENKIVLRIGQDRL
jgi:hypothetical protein